MFFFSVICLLKAISVWPYWAAADVSISRTGFCVPTIAWRKAKVWSSWTLANIIIIPPFFSYFIHVMWCDGYFILCSKDVLRAMHFCFFCCPLKSPFFSSSREIVERSLGFAIYYKCKYVWVGIFGRFRDWSCYKLQVYDLIHISYCFVFRVWSCYKNRTNFWCVFIYIYDHITLQLVIKFLIRT